MKFFNSSLRSLMFVKLQSPSGNSRNSAKLATKDLKITLGSQVDGRGRFLGHTVASINSAVGDGPLPFSGGIRSFPIADEQNATHREHYEETSESRQPHNWPLNSTDKRRPRSEFADPSSEDAELGLTPTSGYQKEVSNREDGTSNWSGWRKMLWRLDENRTGYWDLLSVFRTGRRRSMSQSILRSENVSSGL